MRTSEEQSTPTIETHTIMADSATDDAVPVNITKRTSISTAVLETKYICYCASEGTLAELGDVLLEDAIIEASDAFIFAGRIMGKSAEGRTKWGSAGKNVDIVIASIDANSHYEVTRKVTLLVPTVESPLLETGVFNTLTIRPANRPAHDNHTRIEYVSQSESSIPRVLLGLSALDFYYGHNLRIEAALEQVSHNSALINLQSWGDTVHHGSACSWIKLPPSEEEQGCSFQCGRLKTTEYNSCDKSPTETTHRVVFERPYDSPPVVAVWFDTLDVAANHEQDTSVRVWTNCVTASGFTLNIDTWNKSKLFRAGVSWLAYPTQRTDITSGSYSTNEIRSASCPRLQNSGYTCFTGTRFTSVPRVFLALKSVSFGRGANTRPKQLSASEVTTTGMTWHIDSFYDTVLHSVDVSFIAF